MGSPVNFQTTKFVDIKSDLSEGNVSYGYRIWDRYGSLFENSLTREEVAAMTPENAVNCMQELTEENASIYDAVVQKGGFIFNGEWAELNEI